MQYIAGTAVFYFHGNADIIPKHAEHQNHDPNYVIRPEKTSANEDQAILMGCRASITLNALSLPLSSASDMVERRIMVLLADVPTFSRHFH
jgi:hypothetical protein